MTTTKNRIHGVLAGALVVTGCAGSSFGGSTHAYIIEGSGFFGAPGIELAVVGRVNLSDPSDVEVFPMAGDVLRFGGADMSSSGSLIAVENTTNSLRALDVMGGGNTLIDSIGFMESGVVGMALTNDGSTAIVVNTVGAFLRFIQADAATGEVLSVNNILSFNPISSLAIVPEGHPTLDAGDLYGLATTNGGGVQLVEVDLGANTIASTLSVSGIGFSAQFETGLDFAPDGTLYAVVQGFNEVSPDVFVEISSSLFTVDTSTGAASEVGVIESSQTWDAVTLVVEEAGGACLADLTGEGDLNFLDVSAFLSAYGAMDPSADFETDGSFNFLDVSAFLAAFAAGCP
ncbi:MAG: GC-type dockerin domain-anchored protein [Phycisphaerales bacterium]